MLIACPHHSEATTEHHEEPHSDAPCAHQHNCISTFQFIVPAITFESDYQFENNHKLNFAKVLLADPFIEAPFQPPRLS